MYEDADNSGWVIKMMHSGKSTPERAAKLRAMIANPPDSLSSMSWPVELEEKNGTISYRMPKAPPGTETAYRFISAPMRKKLPTRMRTYEYRANLGAEIAPWPSSDFTP